MCVCAVTVAARKARPSIVSHEQSRSSPDRIGTDISIRSHFASVVGFFHFPFSNISLWVHEFFCIGLLQILLLMGIISYQGLICQPWHGRDNRQCSSPAACVRSWRKEVNYYAENAMLVLCQDHYFSSWRADA